jgi:hypothetical protein
MARSVPLNFLFFFAAAFCYNYLPIPRPSLFIVFGVLAPKFNYCSYKVDVPTDIEIRSVFFFEKKTVQYFHSRSGLRMPK